MRRGVDSDESERARTVAVVRGNVSILSVPARAAVLRVARAFACAPWGVVVRGVVVVRVVVSAGRVLDVPSRTAEYAGASANMPAIAHKIRILFISVSNFIKNQKMRQGYMSGSVSG